MSGKALPKHVLEHRRTEIMHCLHCGKLTHVWKQTVCKGKTTWQRRRGFCSQLCAVLHYNEQQKQRARQLANNRAAETKQCKNCKQMFPRYRVYKQGTNGLHYVECGDFCSLECHNENQKRKKAHLADEMINCECCGRSFKKWHSNKRSGGWRVRRFCDALCRALYRTRDSAFGGRSIGRKDRKPINVTEQVKAVDILGSLLTTFSSTVGDGVDFSETSSLEFLIKPDGRLRGQNGPKIRSTPIIRLGDERIFDNGVHVALTYGKPNQASSVYHCCKIGRLFCGQQFMFLEDWINADEPKVHPLSSKLVRGKLIRLGVLPAERKIRKSRSPMSEQHRAKLSAAASTPERIAALVARNKASIGRSLSADQKAKISAYMKDRPKSEKTKSKMSEAAYAVWARRKAAG